MKEGVEAVQQQNESSAESMSVEISAIHKLVDANLYAEAIEALENFIDTHESAKLDESAEDVLWRAQVYLKTLKASTEISQLAA
jgi:predicted GNAT superfamily acetyltransferase